MIVSILWRCLITAVDFSNMNLSDIKEASVKSVKWVYLGRCIKPLIVIILARLLTPEDYGLIAIATIVLSFTQIFQDLGLCKALIQTQSDENQAANVVFWGHLVMSCLFYALLFVSAPLIARFFHEEKVIPILRILSLGMIVNSLGATHRTLLQRRFLFRRLFSVQLVPSIIPIAITIPLAASGFGVWALVCSSLAGAVVSAVLLWLRCPWRPWLGYNFALAGQLFGFGWLAAMESFFAWFYITGDTAIVGYYLSAKILGLYVVSFNLMTLILNTILSPISSIVYPALSRIQDDKLALQSAFRNLLRLSASIALPIGAGIYSTAVPIAIIVFGGKWDGIQAPLSILALVQGLSWIVTVNPDVYRAIGRPDIMPKFSGARLLYVLPAYILSARYGLMPFCYAKLAVVLVGLLLHLILAIKVLNISYSSILGSLWLPFAASTLMGAVVYGATKIIQPFEGFAGLLKLSALIALGFSIYVLVLWLVDAQFVRKWLRLANSAIRSRSSV